MYYARQNQKTSERHREGTTQKYYLGQKFGLDSWSVCGDGKGHLDSLLSLVIMARPLNLMQSYFLFGRT